MHRVRADDEHASNGARGGRHRGCGLTKSEAGKMSTLSTIDGLARQAKHEVYLEPFDLPTLLW